MYRKKLFPKTICKRSASEILLPVRNWNGHVSTATGVNSDGQGGHALVLAMLMLRGFWNLPWSMVTVSINQSIKTSFLIYTGAGTHPKNGPCRRLGNAQRGAPVKGRLQ